MGAQIPSSWDEQGEGAGTERWREDERRLAHSQGFAFPPEEISTSGCNLPPGLWTHTHTRACYELLTCYQNLIIPKIELSKVGQMVALSSASSDSLRTGKVRATHTPQITERDFSEASLLCRFIIRAKRVNSRFWQVKGEERSDLWRSLSEVCEAIKDGQEWWQQQVSAVISRIWRIWQERDWAEYWGLGEWKPAGRTSRVHSAFVGSPEAPALKTTPLKKFHLFIH